ncbi:hypothetical protein ACLBX9_09815 [Methylobacterium sp. A49B]
MSTPTTKVLMSVGNPTGWKLEALLAQIVEDLRVKNDALEGDASPTSTAIRINNLGVIDCLALAGVRQLDTLRRLDLLGPDQGPAGTPRIGASAVPMPQASAPAGDASSPHSA